ncbi:MAG: lamin tail domain-containing protein [Pleurocapsa sp. MO_192.B19]|nr:lamin tail domain-containing protein [Pleurocapsa sp. MO_192.B19]
MFDATSDTLETTTTSNSTDGTYSLDVSSDGTYFVVLDHLDSDAPSITTALPDRTVRSVTISGTDAINEDFPYDLVGTSFATCPVDAYLFQNDPSDAYSLNLVTGNQNLEANDIGNREINAIGFNLADSFIYGSNNTDEDGTISRVDSSFNVTTLGPIVGLPSGTSFPSGDVSLDEKLYLKSGTNIYIIDVDPASATYLQLESLIPDINITLSDFAFNPIDGQIYTVDSDNNNLYRINLNPVSVEDLGNIGTNSNRPFGAQFYDASGFLYISRNQDGTIFRIDTRNSASIDPTATFFANGPIARRNDGARCPNAPISIDFGDAPESYSTSLSNDGARHDISSGTSLYLGNTSPDSETDGQASNAADGDGSDEDNLTFPTLTSGSTSYTIPAANITATNTTGQSATLHAWIDFDNSGTFEDTEHTSVVVDDATNGGNPTGDLTWNGINVGAAGDTYARFRLTTDSSINDTTPGGVASDGEVEDHQIAIADPSLSPLAGQLIINEVLFRQTNTGAPGNDEFIELHNPTNSPVDISDWQLIDGNLVVNDTDGIGSINGNSSPFVFPAGTIVNPGDYVVVWIGDETADKQADDAAFQFYLGQAPKLRDRGDDVWLYDPQTRIVDYIAYGSNNTTSQAINTPPDISLNLWNDTYQDSLRSVTNGQSISLTPNGQDGNASGCWERTTSNDANATGRCTGFLPTRDTDEVTNRTTSVGVSNNASAELILVKRITAINPGQSDEVRFNTFVDDPDTDSDNEANWPSDANTYLPGEIDVTDVKPGDEVEYTIYFLSNGTKDASNVRICDVIPDNMTFSKDAFGTELGIALGLNNASLPTASNFQFLSNLLGDDQGEFYGPGTIPPSFCQKTDPNDPDNLIPVTSSNDNVSGAVLIKLDDPMPPATDAGTPANSYGLIRFSTKVR